MGQYVKVKDLPTAVQAALTSVGYGRVDIEVRASATVVLSSSGGSGSRGFTTLVNLTTGQHQTSWGSWGGQNMFDRSNAVDNDRNEYPLPADGLAITGTQSGGQPIYAVVHVPASMVDRMLPAAAAEFTTEEKDALYAHACVKGGQYRRDHLVRKGVRPETVTDLVTRGLLSRNKAGATSVTTDGRNALGDYRSY